MKEFGACVTRRAGPVVAVSQKGKKYEIQNKSGVQIDVVEIDDCVIKKGKRCDYLMVVDSDDFRYIELKGSNIKQAVNQIRATIPQTVCKCCKKILCVIISSPTPKITATKQRAQRQLLKEFGAELVISSVKLVHRT